MKNFKKQNFYEKTKLEFQSYTKKEITDGEAYEIQKNFFGFIELLVQWSAKAQEMNIEN